ncbi:MAG: carbohydrate ABC transporter permease [Fimbriimonas sp.]
MFRRPRSLLVFLVLSLLGAIFAWPLVWQISTSLKTPDRVQSAGSEVLPQASFVNLDGESVRVRPLKRQGDLQEVMIEEGARKGETRRVRPDEISLKPFLRWDNYREGFAAFPFLLMLRNTLVICFLAVLGTVLSSSLVAYGLACIEWRGREVLFWVMLSTMMLPGQVTMIPLFLTFKSLGWINTILPLVVPAFCGNAFFIFLLRQFYRTIPLSLIEAAKLESATDLQVWRSVVLPLSRPALAVVAVFTFIASWNDFLGPLIYLMDDDKYTLAIGLARFQGQYGSDWGRMMAMAVVMTVPTIVIFFLAQRTFVEGIRVGGVRG